MHNAPSVSYPVGRSRNAQYLLLALWLLGATAAALASAHSVGSAWRDGVLLLCVALAAAAAGAGARQLGRAATLTFDGEYWAINGGADLSMAEARVMLDLQRLLLIRLNQAGSMARWVWADRGLMPQRWRDLRCALYSRAIPKQTPDRSSAVGTAHHSST